jgi:ribulose-phosphate 3-epimerase
MTQIVPAILAKSKQQFESQLRAVEHECTLIQVDALDNTLFPNANWFDAKEIGSLQTTAQMELHLMVENPIPIIEAWKQNVTTFVRAIVSAEMERPLGAVVHHIKDVLNLEVGVAINPETPLHQIESVMHHIDCLTIMSVHPGFQGQSFGDSDHGFDPQFIFDKIKRARNHRPDLTIEVDGGVREDLIQPLIDVGVDRIGIGSLIFKDEHPTEKLKVLNALV